jgi:uncharacterized lipoprotein YddW (UPF0748 family)
MPMMFCWIRVLPQRLGRTARWPRWRWLRSILALAVLMAALVVAFGGHGGRAMAQQARTEIRGVWMTGNDRDVLMDPAKLQNAVNQLSRLNFNTLYPVVWNSGYVMYPSAVGQQFGLPYIHQGRNNRDTLADLISVAHQRNLLVIPWFEFGFMAPSSSELALGHPEWLTQRRDGSQSSDSSDAGEVVWLNPFRPDVQDFITRLVVEVVTQYNADGIQFDDHMSLPNEFGYDPYTVALYRQETQKNPPSNPKDAAWVRWRADKITAFMVRLNQAVKARKSNAIFSVAPNYYDFAYKLHLQDWLAWVRQGIVDELIVQVYRSDLNSFVGTASRSEIQETQQSIPTAIGILSGLRGNRIPARRVWAQTEAVRDRGLGMVYFYYEGLWDLGPESMRERQAGFQSLFAQPAPRSLAAPPIRPMPEPML